PLPYRLFPLLLAKCFNTIPQLWLAVEIRFADICRFCYRVEIDRLVSSQEAGDGIIDPLVLFLFALMRMGNKTGCVTFPGFLTHLVSSLASACCACRCSHSSGVYSRS